MFAGPAPDIHRLFYDGMSRTFEGSLVTTGSLADAAEELAPLDLVLPAQYYSDVKALPEQGDPVTFGEIQEAGQARRRMASEEPMAGDAVVGRVVPRMG